MKCPKCGTRIREGFLYCEHCGEDIHIVPDFEPELEYNIAQTINGIAQEIEAEEKEITRLQEQDALLRQKKLQKRKRRLVWLGICVGVLFLAAVGTGIAAYLHNSLSWQVSRAAECMNSGKYDKAIQYYTQAIELDETDIELQFALAEVYFLKNNKIEYEFLLREIVKNPRAATEHLERAYGKLIAIYRARGDYATINELLLASNNDSIISTYQSYIAMEPEFSIREGYYNGMQPLKITAFGKGKIYYTMDGSTPTTESAQYTAPILLEDGDYVIKAYFVNENGIASDCVTKEYHIEIDEIPPPAVSAVSGEYHFPIYIEILSDPENVFYTTDGTRPTYASHIEIDEIPPPAVSAVSGEYHFPIYIEILSDPENVFYTTDGTRPTYASAPYRGPIPMPLGKSKFIFAKIEEGRTGTETERTYELTMNTEFMPEDAVKAVVEYSVANGKILDESGSFDDTQAAYLYEYQYVTNIGQIDDFYVISEIFRDAAGVLAKTGNDFAVNAYTGELFKLQRDTNNQLMLTEIEKDSQQ